MHPHEIDVRDRTAVEWQQAERLGAAYVHALELQARRQTQLLGELKAA